MTPAQRKRLRADIRSALRADVGAMCRDEARDYLRITTGQYGLLRKIDRVLAELDREREQWLERRAAVESQAVDALVVMHTREEQ